MFELEQVCNNNILYYNEYEKAFETDLKYYQSRIYPSKHYQYLCWYHIKADGKYIGSVWLERKSDEAFAILGIFIADKKYRGCGIGKAVIKRIIKSDLQNVHTNRILLRVRAENQRAISCYKSVGFTEKRKYSKDNHNVIEMIWEGQE